MLGLGKVHGIDAVCIMGETFGLPLITDPKAADRVLHVLVKVLGLKVDMSKLENTIKEMEDRIEKTDKIHKKMLQQISKGKSEDIKYIG